MIMNSANCGAVFCDYEIVGEDDRFLGTIPTAIFPELVRLSLINPQRTPHPGVMFRKSLVEQCGGYLNGDFPVEDLGLWIRLSAIAELRSIPSSLLTYRIRRNSTTYREREKMLNATSKLFQTFVPELSNLDFLEISRKQLLGYKGISRGDYRHLLAVRDLMKLVSLSNFPRKIRWIFYFKFATSIARPRFISPTLILLAQFIQRKRYRLEVSKSG